MLTIILQILPLFLLIGTGWFLSNRKIAFENWIKPIGNFAFYVGFPALIFYKLIQTKIPASEVYFAFSLNSILLLGLLSCVLLSFVFLKLSNTNKATLVLCFMFGNLAFLGIPLLSSIDESYSQMAVLNASVYLFWIFSLGILIVEFLIKRDGKWYTPFINLLKNPLLIAVLLGLAFNNLQLTLPQVLFTPIKMLGDAVSPLVMLMIGIFMHAHPIKKIAELKLPVIYTLTKLLLFPCIAILLLCKTSIKEASFTMVVDLGMPSAITTFAMAEIYGLNKKFVANAIVLSTAVSIITLPLIIWLIT